MRNIIILFVLLTFCAFSSIAEEAFVTARICVVYNAAEPSAAKNGILKNGQQVTILNESGDWLQIKTDKIEGYVNKKFIGSDPGVVLDSIADGREDMSSVEVRKRASTYTSSAAAIRGLSSEDVRERENVAFKNYDFESIEWIEENFSYTAEEIINFSMEEFFN